MLNTVNLFVALVVAAITYGTPLLFGTLGEVLTEKSGSLNLGVEGIMFMGGAIGLGGVFYYEKAVESPSAFLAVLIGLLCAFIAGGIASLIFSFLTITLRANQNVTGLALTIFGTGVGQYIGEIMRIREGGFVAVGNDLKAVFISSPFPQAMQDIPYVGKILFGNSIFFYLGVVLAIVMHLFLNKSRTGLQLRSVGESPATADAAGINVSRYRYLGAIIGGGIGYALKTAISQGAKRGLFSNEAGLGSTPHAHALAKVERPQDQGAVAILGVFVDTFVVLTLTGLVLITSGLIPQGMTGTALTQAAFSQAFGGFGPIFIAVCMFFFAFSTIIGWYFFGQSNFKALFGEKLLPVYSIIVVAFILVGSTLKVDLVWALADLFNGLMAVPNLLALLALAGVVVAIDRK